MKLVLVLGVVVGVLLVQANAVPVADAVDQAVGQQDVDVGGQNDAVESSDDAQARRKRGICLSDYDCDGHHCYFDLQVPYCNYWGKCKCKFHGGGHKKGAN